MYVLHVISNNGAIATFKIVKKHQLVKNSLQIIKHITHFQGTLDAEHTTGQRMFIPDEAAVKLIQHYFKTRRI